MATVRGSLTSAGAAYLGGSLGAVAAYPILPSPGRVLSFLLVAGGSEVLVLRRLRHVVSGGRRPWWLALGGIVAVNVGHVVRSWPSGGATGVAVSGVFVAAGTALVLVAALEVVARRRGDDVGGLVDAGTLAMAAGVLLCGSGLLARLTATGPGAAGPALTLATVFGVSAIVGALGRLLGRARGCARAVLLLAVALPLLLVGNVLTMALPDRTVGVVAAMMLMSACTVLGLLSLGASVTRPARLESQSWVGPTVGQLTFLGTVLALVLVLDGGRQMFRHNFDGMMVGVGGAAVTILLTTRLARLASEQTRMNGTLVHQATHDSLTGLPNRRALMAFLDVELRRRYGCLVLFCDLNGFKAVNDHFGHPAGDRVLVEVGQRLRQCVREHDMVSRFGGDEFVILYRDAARRDDALLCARLHDALRHPIGLGDDSVVLGMSIGVAYADGRADVPADQLIRLADEAMYADKRRQQAVSNR